jgi:hypothetical protein
LPLFGLGPSSKGIGTNLKLSTNKIAWIHWSLDLGPSSKVALSFTTCFSIFYLGCTHIYLCTSVFFFFPFPSFFNFVVCKLCWFFPFHVHFFLEFTLLKRIFPISSKFLCSHSAKIHQEKKSLLCTDFLLFFDSRFICYDRPCNFSFSTQAAPIIATGPGEPAPTLVHSPSWVRLLRACLSRFRDPDFV